MVSDRAIKMRLTIEQAMQSVDDKTASEFPNLLPLLRGGDGTIPAGYRIQRDGVVLKAKIPMWDRPEYYPEAQPDLWQKIPYRDGYRIIPETITVTEAFSQGERGWWGDTLYESLHNNNTFTPEQYAEWWKKI